MTPVVDRFAGTVDHPSVWHGDKSSAEHVLFCIISVNQRYIICDLVNHVLILDF